MFSWRIFHRALFFFGISFMYVYTLMIAVIVFCFVLNSKKINILVLFDRCHLSLSISLSGWKPQKWVSNSQLASPTSEQHFYGVHKTLHILRLSSDNINAANCCLSGVSLVKEIKRKWKSSEEISNYWFNVIFDDCVVVDVFTIYLAQRSIPSLSSSLRTRLRFGRIAGTSLLWSFFNVCRSGLDAFRLALKLFSIVGRLNYLS